jgi:hypothetical protein
MTEDRGSGLLQFASALKRTHCGSEHEGFPYMSSSGRKLQLVASFGVLLLMALVGVGCNGFFVDPVLTAIQVGPSGQGILVTHTLQMKAVGTYDQSSGAPKDITGKVLWTTSDEGIATVSAGGLVTGVGVGTATITASSGVVTGTASITISLTGVTSIAVTPSSQSVSASGGIPFCLQAIAAPSGTDISTTATWTFADPSNAAETGIAKTTGASCAGQAFLIGTLAPTPAPTTINATASAPSTTGTVTSPQVTINITP